MKERPILFRAEMVRALLDGRKSQTRRVVKPQPDSFGPGEWHWNGWRWQNHAGTTLRGPEEDCPYGTVGTRLWVRETHAWLDRHIDGLDREDPCVVGYPSDDAILRFDPNPTKLLADRFSDYGNLKLRPSIFMPRWASRITLEIVSVRVERVQDITEEDARAEGVDSHGWYRLSKTPSRSAFQDLWDSINSKSHPWDSDPWVWVLAFKRV